MWEFQLVTLERTTPPAAPISGSWYRYTIANRITEITGTRQGSKEDVSRFVRESLQRLNNRHRTPSFSHGRVLS